MQAYAYDSAVHSLQGMIACTPAVQYVDYDGLTLQGAVPNPMQFIVSNPQVLHISRPDQCHLAMTDPASSFDDGAIMTSFDDDADLRLFTNGRLC